MNKYLFTIKTDQNMVKIRNLSLDRNAINKICRKSIGRVEEKL